MSQSHPVGAASFNLSPRSRSQRPIWLPTSSKLEKILLSQSSSKLMSLDLLRADRNSCALTDELLRSIGQQRPMSGYEENLARAYLAVDLQRILWRWCEEGLRVTMEGSGRLVNGMGMESEGKVGGGDGPEGYDCGVGVGMQQDGPDGDDDVLGHSMDLEVRPAPTRLMLGSGAIPSKRRSSEDADEGMKKYELCMSASKIPRTMVEFSTTTTTTEKCFQCPFNLRDPNQHPDCKRKQFPNPRKLKEHIWRFTKPFKCPTCGEGFGREKTKAIHCDQRKVKCTDKNTDYEGSPEQHRDQRIERAKTTAEILKIFDEYDVKVEPLLQRPQQGQGQHRQYQQGSNFGSVSSTATAFSPDAFRTIDSPDDGSVGGHSNSWSASTSPFEATAIMSTPTSTKPNPLIWTQNRRYAVADTNTNSPTRQQQVAVPPAPIQLFPTTNTEHSTYPTPPVEHIQTPVSPMNETRNMPTASSSMSEFHTQSQASFGSSSSASQNSSSQHDFGSQQTQMQLLSFHDPPLYPGHSQHDGMLDVGGGGGRRGGGGGLTGAGSDKPMITIPKIVVSADQISPAMSYHHNYSPLAYHHAHHQDNSAMMVDTAADNNHHQIQHAHPTMPDFGFPQLQQHDSNNNDNTSSSSSSSSSNSSNSSNNGDDIAGGGGGGGVMMHSEGWGAFPPFAFRVKSSSRNSNNSGLGF